MIFVFRALPFDCRCHSVKVTLKRKRTSTARASSHMKDLDHGSNTDLHRTAGTLLSHVKNNKCHKKSAKRGKIANPNKTKKSTFSTGCSTHSDNTSSVECPHLPPELWLKVFQSVVRNAGPLPFLCRYKILKVIIPYLFKKKKKWPNNITTVVHILFLYFYNVKSTVA